MKNFINSIKLVQGQKVHGQNTPIPLIHLKSFLKFKYNTNDIRFVDLNYNFISAFDIYLRTEKVQ